jgi:hypothetical protein
MDAGRGVSGMEPGSTSETHSGVPSGAARNCTLPPNALCFCLNHRSLPLSRTPARRSVSISMPPRITWVMPSHRQRSRTSKQVGAWAARTSTLVQVAVAGGLGDASLAAQAVDAAALAEPAQHQRGLGKRAGRPATAWGTDLPPVGGQETGQLLHDVAGASSVAT